MRAYIETFGCQMNESDSERILYLLEKEGYSRTNVIEKSDIIVINTCTVREKAKNKLYGHIGNLKKIKEKNRDVLICIGGCAAQDLKENIIGDFPYVDIVFGTHNIPELPELINKRISSGKNVCSIKKNGFDPDVLKVKRNYKFKAFIPIIMGCNNNCSYCIVPRVRGKEISIESGKIINYVKELVSQGVIEITLIGQNVNSYGKNLDNPCSFSELLDMVSGIKGLKRIRFMTSNPMDFSKSIIDIIKSKKNITKHIHLPFQSGSNSILKKMRRKYTREDYLGIIYEIKREIPDCSITTDVIVGFPGEEKKDFLETIDVVKKSRFIRAFTFIYSPRKGTLAAKMDDYISYTDKKRWFNELVEVQNRISYEENNKFIGNKYKVLVEVISRKNPEILSGRMENNIIVNFKGTKNLVGKLAYVYITGARTFYLTGETIT
ncbi:MAG: tRNA (N6-isopentenyl adenosine(37)-C2)-methylthiotransferase MiaB [Actinomycetota bacterium]|nr:tRNA (N6-isopentenyl adenosine(37)-C2)-methylthiotransferase MiaB [Actinomycetota bacterium]